MFDESTSTLVAIATNLKPQELLFIGLTVAMTLYGVIGIRRVRDEQDRLLQNLNQVRIEGVEQATHPVIQSLLHEHERAMRRQQGQANVAILVDRAMVSMRSGGKPLTYWVRMVKAAISLCVGLGLVGTFVGLILALFGVTGALEQAAGQTGASREITALLSQLRTLIGGMTTAFQASIWGVSGSLLLTLYSSLQGTFTRGEEVAHELEYYLLNEHEGASAAAGQVDVQALLLERISALTQTLELSFAAGMGDAAQQFGLAASSMAAVLQSIEPVTNSLGASGTSLQTLSTGLGEVTTDLRNVMAALKISQEQLPQRMLQLQQVEESLIVALGALPQQNIQLLGGVDHFNAAARQLSGTLTSFRQEWPTMVQEFVTHTEQAVERQSLAVAESIERLREIIELGRRDALEQMEQLVALNATRADAIASALGPGSQTYRRQT